MRKITVLPVLCALLCGTAASAAGTVNVRPISGGGISGAVITVSGSDCFTREELNEILGSFGCPQKPETEPTYAPEATETPVEPEITEAPAEPETTETPIEAPSAEPEITAPPVETPPAPTETPENPDGAYEREVWEIVNRERAKNGLAALDWAEDLAAVARAHSRDMAENGYFSHTDLSGGSPFDRLRNAGISYRTAGENIAYGQRTPEAVMTAWMNSSGHRANILNAGFKELGVGAARAKNGTIYWTQCFAAR